MGMSFKSHHKRVKRRCVVPPECRQPKGLKKNIRPNGGLSKVERRRAKKKKLSENQGIKKVYPPVIWLTL